MRPSFQKWIPALCLSILITILPVITFSQNRLLYQEALHVLAMEMPVQLGEDVPAALPFQYLLHDRHWQGRLSDFQGKLVILDFWASWCSNCTSAFSTLDALQRQFPDQLQIMLVNSASTQDTPEKIKAVIAKWEQLHGRKFILPVIHQDSLLDKTFPHRLLPHYVWIDGQGHLKATTTSASVTADNIRAILENRHVTLPAKQDQLNVDLRKPLLLTEAVTDQADAVRTKITGHLEGMGSWAGIHRDPTGNFINRVYATNVSILSLYELSYRGQLPFPFRNRVILAVKDSTRYDFPKEALQLPSWSKHNTFSYELAVPSSLSGNIFQIMRKNLNAYFKCEVRVEKRQMQCLVLAKLRADPSLHTAGGVQKVSFMDSTVIRNRPLKTLTDALARDRNAPPVLDETHYAGNVDMVLHASIAELPKLKQELHKYGLDLIKATRNVDMIVISDIKTK